MKNNIIQEGFTCGKNGGKLKDNPYKDFSELYNWERGFHLASPNEETPIELLFEITFGGPLRLEEAKKQVNKDTYKYLGKCEIPFGDWYNPKNYKDTECGSYINTVFEKHILKDGAYDVTDLPSYYLKNVESIESIDEGWITKKGLDFFQKHGAENIYLAIAYQVEGVFLFSGKPKKIKNHKGYFGQGACALFENCPKSILIIAEDD